MSNKNNLGRSDRVHERHNVESIIQFAVLGGWRLMSRPAVTSEIHSYDRCLNSLRERFEGGRIVSPSVDCKHASRLNASIGNNGHIDATARKTVLYVFCAHLLLPVRVRIELETMVCCVLRVNRGGAFCASSENECISIHHEQMMISHG